MVFLCVKWPYWPWCFDELLKGAMPEVGWNQVHRQRFPLLQLGSNQQRRRRRRHSESLGERYKDQLDEYEPELGSKLAVKRSSDWSVTLLQSHSQWPTHHHLMEHRSGPLAVRSNLHRKEFPSVKTRWYKFPLLPFLSLTILVSGFLLFFMRGSKS